MSADPILPGFHPDPSVCRVGEDYYLITSTFEWFPGVPIFHSRDLVNWRQLGHVLDRPSQLPLDKTAPSKGVYAATIRHHEGVFYVITTLVDRPANLLVTATDPAGPWSEPIWLPPDGIDPSLFFDDDGRAWVTGSRPVDDRGGTEIWLRQLDLTEMRLAGRRRVIWNGTVKGAVWPEGPHLYKVEGEYYLLTAEGGTGHDHAVMAARAESVTGPYEGAPRNPVYTHRHLGRHHPIVGTGHGDLVQTQMGEWWMVLLAMRPYGGYHYNLGRETFLTRVTWEDGWPVVAPVEDPGPPPALPAAPWPAEPACDNFESARLAPCWNHLRTPREQYWSLTDRPGHLRLRLRPETLAERVNPAFVGRRQRHRDFAAVTAMEFAPVARHESAGVALVQNHDFHILLVVSADGVRVVRRVGGAEEVLAREAVPEGRLYLAVHARGQEYAMRWATDPACWRELCTVDGRVLSSTVAGGFTGAYLGMYATSDGYPTSNHADFDWFEYQGLG